MSQTLVGSLFWSITIFQNRYSSFWKFCNDVVLTSKLFLEKERGSPFSLSNSEYFATAIAQTHSSDIWILRHQYVDMTLDSAHANFTGLIFSPQISVHWTRSTVGRSSFFHALVFSNNSLCIDSSQIQELRIWDYSGNHSCNFELLSEPTRNCLYNGVLWKSKFHRSISSGLQAL